MAPVLLRSGRASLAATVILGLTLWVEAAKRYGYGLQLKPTGGAKVRLYAPAATAVSVSGSWNNWAQPGSYIDELLSEGNGWWSGDLSPRVGLGPGAEYKFVLRLANGNLLWRPDPWSRLKKPESLGNSVAYKDDSFRWTDGTWTMPPWEHLVIYELHVGTFGRDPDKGLPATLLDAARFVDHFVELGVNAVQLMPVAEFDGDVDMGYTTAYPYAVENAYGGPDAMKAFVDKCHSRGIAVLLDVVYNHWGPMDLALWQFDGWHDANNKGGIYFYNDERADTPWGDTRPNYGLGYVRDYIRDSALYWLDVMHVDGLRVDGVSFIRMYGGDIERKGAIQNPDGASLLRSIVTAARNLERPRLLIAEDLQSNLSITEPVAEGGLGFDTQWDAKFRWIGRRALAASDGAAGAFRTGAVRDVVLKALGGGIERVIYTESHDDSQAPLGRLPLEASPDNPRSLRGKRAAALGAALALTVPGIPMLFQGQEFFETDSFSPSQALNWSRLGEAPGVFRLYKRLVALRRNRLGRSRGLTGPNADVFLADSTNGVVAYRRWKDGGVGDDVVVILNLQEKPLTNFRLGFPGSGNWTLAVDTDDPGFDREFGRGPRPAQAVLTEFIPAHGQAQSATVTLGSRSCAIYLYGKSIRRVAEAMTSVQEQQRQPVFP